MYGFKRNFSISFSGLQLRILKPSKNKTGIYNMQLQKGKEKAFSFPSILYESKHLTGKTAWTLLNSLWLIMEQ